jgi:hypothetical protein
MDTSLELTRIHLEESVMDRFDSSTPRAYRRAERDDSVGPAWAGRPANEVPAAGVHKPGPLFASVLPTERLSRIDCLHVIPALSSTLPMRVYAASPLTHLPHSLFPHLLSTARVWTVSAGTLLVDPEQNCREYLAVLAGELEVQRERVAVAGADEIQIGRLMNSAGTQGIILLHTIPRRASVRAMTAARVLQLDGMRVEALLAWMLRCDARRKPPKVRR